MGVGHGGEMSREFNTASNSEIKQEIRWRLVNLWDNNKMNRQKNWEQVMSTVWITHNEKIWEDSVQDYTPSTQNNAWYVTAVQNCVELMNGKMCIILRQFYVTQNDTEEKRLRSESGFMLIVLPWSFFLRNLIFLIYKTGIQAPFQSCYQ